MTEITDPGKSARRRSRESEKALERQRKQEELRAAESESEIQRRRIASQRGGGRSSLLVTSPTGTQGLPKNLGG